MHLSRGTSIAEHQALHWSKPPLGFLKVNSDAAFDSTRGIVGMEWCLRDAHGIFLKAETCTSNSTLQVAEGVSFRNFQCFKMGIAKWSHSCYN